MSFSVNEIKPLKNYVLIELPNEAGERIQQHKSGLYLSFLLQKAEVYAPVYGTVLKHGKTAKQIKSGDKVFFHYLNFENGRHSDEKWARGIYFPEVLSFEGEKVSELTEDRKKYMLIRESELLFGIREDKIFCLNDNVVLRSIPIKLKEIKVENTATSSAESWSVFVSDSTSPIMDGVYNKDEYRKDIAEVIAAPKDLKVKAGDVVYPDKHWDVNVEYDVLQSLGYPVYYIAKEYIGGLVGEI